MSIFTDAKRDHLKRRDRTATTPDPTAAASTSILAQRQNTVTVDGATFEIEEPATVQSGEKNWLSAVGKFGRPRGRDAIQARKISQTAAMETITNGIVDQLLGGELTAESDESDIEGPAGALWDLIRDVIEGPHPMGNDLDDLITGAVADMIGPGNAYWQLLASDDGTVPVIALLPLDALTIRHNLKANGFVPEGEPAYWQAKNAFTEEGIASFGDVEPVALPDEQLAVMHYPRGKRPYQVYPKSPSLQVLEWLEILVNSTTHHNRYYSDNEIPPGFVQVLNASNRTVEDVKDKLQAAKGDPRSVQVIGGEGQAMWVEMGGTAVNLDVISEQQWFFELCLGSLGLGKAEIGLIEDVNRANGEIEASRVFKRITGPFAKQFESVFLKIARRFDAYERLDEPFRPKLRFTDPREERAREQRLREMFLAGGLSTREYYRRRGDADLASDADRFQVSTADGDVIDYGDDPLWVAKRKVDAALGTSMTAEEEGDGDDEEDEPLVVGQGAGGDPLTNGDGR